MIFPLSFLDSSSWNDNQLDFEQHAHHQQVRLVSGDSGGDYDGSGSNNELLQPSIMQQGTLPEGADGCSSGGRQVVGPAKRMPMSERARLAQVPQPEQGLKCPRCDSGNTKFCYFNNYSLTQPRHFCRACRRCWTRGGALRNVPVGGYRSQAKRAKPNQAAAAAVASAANGTTAMGGCATLSASACTTMANAASVFPAMLQSGGDGNLSGLLLPLLYLADFDARSLGSTFSGMVKPCVVDAGVGCYPVGGTTAAARLERCRVQQMQDSPFFHAIADQHHSLAPAASPEMAMPGMFHYRGPDNGGDGGGGGQEDYRGDQQFHHATMMPSKREGYPRSGSIALYGGDHHLTAGPTAYTSSYSNTVTGNHLL